MSNDHDQDTFALLPRYAACYLALAVATAVSIWLLLQLRRVIVLIGLALNVSSWTMTVVDEFGFIMLGLLWLISFIVLENYLRHGVPTNQLTSRIMRVFWWEMILTIFVFVAQQILT